MILLKDNSMLCLTKKPGENAQVDRIENTLEALQAFVGGYIETVTVTSDCCIICNEEGRLLGMPHCCTIFGVDFCGPVVIVGIKGEDFCSLRAALVPTLLRSVVEV